MFGGYYLQEKLGNNIFCFDKKNPLWVTKMIEGDILDAKKGKKRVFREYLENIPKSLFDANCQNGNIQSFVGLENCILQKKQLITGQSQYIFLIDNHNWALWCWKYAIEKGIIEVGAKLLHIDQHSDMNPTLNPSPKQVGKLDNFEKFVVEGTTIASFIKPAIELGIVSDVELVLSEYKLLNNYELQITNYDKKTSKKGFFVKNGILDIDLDFWDKKMGHENLDKQRNIIRGLIDVYPLVTIATSPCFIDQNYALELLNWLFGDVF